MVQPFNVADIVAKGDERLEQRQAAQQRSALADLALEQHRQQMATQQRETGISSEMEKLKFMGNAADALLRTDPTQRQAVYQRLRPLAQQVGIDPSQFDQTELSDENLTNLRNTSASFLQNPQQMTSMMQNRQANLKALEGAIDPQTGQLKPRDQLTPAQEAAAIDLGILGRTPTITPEIIGEREKAKLAAQQELKPQLERSIAEAKEIGKFEGQQLNTFPKAVSGLRNLVAKTDTVIDKANDALGQIGFFTTGFIGKALEGLPGSDAFNLRKQVETIKANLSFDELQKMRAASETGGALGSVTERELSLLESAVANLDLGQDDDVLSKNLADVIKQYKRFRDAQISDVQRRGERLGVDIEEFGGVPQLGQQDDTLQQEIQSLRAELLGQ